MTILTDPNTQDPPLRASDTAVEAIWWKQLVEQSRDGIVVLDAQGQVFWVNETFAAMLGCSRDEAAGLEVWDWDSNIPADALRQMLDDVGSSGAHFETVHRRRDGSTYEVDIGTNAVVCADRKLILCICRDISEKNARERELQRLLEETRTLAGELARQKGMLVQSEKLAGLGQLAAGIAHEINNPIAFVSSNCHRMREYVTDLVGIVRQAMDVASLPESVAGPELRRSLEGLRSRLDEADAEFLAEEVYQLLAENSEGISRIRSIVDSLRGYVRKEDRHPTRVRIADVVDSVLAIGRNQWRQAGALEVDLRDDLPEVTWYPRQIEQVLLNLIINSCAAIREQGTIRIGAERRGERIELTVSDDGQGIAAADQPHIFDPFFTTKEVGQGTGLGLYVVRSIVERHGGTISVSSEPGRGASFKIGLPIDVRAVDG